MARQWTREHEARRQRILARMQRQATASEDMSPAAVAARKALPFSEWCHEYLPHWFEAGDAPFHEPADARRNDTGLWLAECWGSGAGKTTRYVIADVLHDICNPVYRWTDRDTGKSWYASEVEVGDDYKQLTRGHRLIFEILGARTEDAAAEKGDIIRFELKNKPRIRADYGDAVTPRLGNDEETDFTANAVRVLARGIGQSLRGQLHNGRRPQKFVGDDLED